MSEMLPQPTRPMRMGVPRPSLHSLRVATHRRCADAGETVEVARVVMLGNHHLRARRRAQRPEFGPGKDSRATSAQPSSSALIALLARCP